VIIGGGFGGLSAAKELKGAPFRVTLLDRTNHYLFQPLLYQVATGLLSPADIAMPTRLLLRRQANVAVLMANVDRIDLATRVVHADADRLRVPFDYLIVATGARHSYFSHPEWEALAPGLKTLDDAREVRRRFLVALEEAEKGERPEDETSLLTFVIVGGGPTGVELAGILPTLAHKGFRRDFRRVDLSRVRVILLEAGPRLLPAFPDTLAARAKRDLEELSVECRTGAMVTKITREAVFVGDEAIPARTVFWAAGNAASPLVATMGVPTDRIGRALVAPDLSVPGYRNVFVAGDASAALLLNSAGQPQVDAANRPVFVPGLAAAANQMGQHAARMILCDLRGETRRPFHYYNKGSLAVIGRWRAVADFGWLQLTGVVAFLTWIFVHLLYLAGFRNRASVLVEWAYAFFTSRSGARLLTEEDADVRPRDRTNASTQRR